jgi:hypothetical protein
MADGKAAMLEIISHRRNTLRELIETPCEYGIEVDIRSQGDRLVIHHDPFLEGEDFEAWFSEYRHGTLILNVKEEGLEQRLLELMASRGVERFFFLDQSFPFLIRTARQGESRCAVRYSEFESAETVLALAGQVQWVWVDLFTAARPNPDDLQRFQSAGFKLCLVSPELQGRWDRAEIDALKGHFAIHGIRFDAVCTKSPEAWA